LVDARPNCSSVSDLDDPFIDLIKLADFSSGIAKSLDCTDIAESFLAK
jgi:hypothetical protein